MKTKEVGAIVVAAGSGTRMGGARPKQYLDLGGRPVLSRTLEAFEKSILVQAVVVVIPPGDVAYCWQEAIRPYGLSKVRQVVEGGKRRQDSVRSGLKALGSEYPIVVVHDGARPLVSPDLIDASVEAMRDARAVITAVPSRDTLKEVDHSGFVKSTLERERIWMVQTPQVFRFEDLMAAHQRAVEKGFTEAPDDSVLVERLGIEVKVIQGSSLNIKITTPEDLDLAGAILSIKQGDGAL